MRKNIAIGNAELLDKFEQCTLNYGEFAAQVGITLGSLNNRLYKARAERLEKVSIPTSRFHLWTDHLKLEGNYLILGDLHIPYHNAEFIERCIKTEFKMLGHGFYHLKIIITFITQH